MQERFTALVFVGSLQNLTLIVWTTVNGLFQMLQVTFFSFTSYYSFAQVNSIKKYVFYVIKTNGLKNVCNNKTWDIHLSHDATL